MISIPNCDLSMRDLVSVNFLDGTVSINNKKFETDLYCKPTDCHQFSKFNTPHLFKSKKSIIIAKGYIFKVCPPSHKHVENSFLVLQRNLLTLKFEGVAKVNQSSYLNVAISWCTTCRYVSSRFHNLGNVVKKTFIYFYGREQVKKCLHQLHLCRSNQVTV